MINETMKNYGQNRSVIRDLFEFGLQKKAEIGEENVYDFSLGNPNVASPRASMDTRPHKATPNAGKPLSMI